MAEERIKPGSMLTSTSQNKRDIRGQTKTGWPSHQKVTRYGEAILRHLPAIDDDERAQLHYDTRSCKVRGTRAREPLFDRNRWQCADLGSGPCKSVFLENGLAQLTRFTYRVKEPVRYFADALTRSSTGKREWQLLEPSRI